MDLTEEDDEEEVVHVEEDQVEYVNVEATQEEDDDQDVHEYAPGVGAGAALLPLSPKQPEK